MLIPAYCYINEYTLAQNGVNSSIAAVSQIVCTMNPMGTSSMGTQNFHKENSRGTYSMGTQSAAQITEAA